MKLVVTLSFLVLCIFSNAQEIPNGNFESWGLNDTPTNWTCSNTEGFQHVFQDSLSHEGEIAMQVFPLSFLELEPGSASTSIDLSYVPSNLGFYAKVGFDVHDSIFVKVQFLNQDYLVYEEVWTAEEEMLEWTQIIIELNQIEPILDECRIIVQSGYGESSENSGNTWISVDAMEFEATPVSISEMNAQLEVNVFPNPAQEVLNFDFGNTDFEKIEINDINGKLVLSSTSTNTLDVSNLVKGMYFVTFFGGTQWSITKQFMKD